MRRAAIGLAVLLAAAAAFVLVRKATGPPYRSTDGASLVDFTLHSRMTGRDLHEILVRPPSGGGRFLLVLLHGRSSSPSSWLSQPFFDELRALGKRAPAVLLLDGGNHSYWHDRRDGRWGTMVVQEAIPAGLARVHASNVALGGISMGGFGALELAARRPGRFCAVGAHSPALWQQAGDTAPGAFDDAPDFSRNDILAEAQHANPYRSRVWVDYGSDDPFRVADAALVQRLQEHGARLVSHVWPGGHTSGYWRAHISQYLRFYADACG